MAKNKEPEVKTEETEVKTVDSAQTIVIVRKNGLSAEVVDPSYWLAAGWNVE